MSSILFLAAAGTALPLVASDAAKAGEKPLDEEVIVTGERLGYPLRGSDAWPHVGHRSDAAP